MLITYRSTLSKYHH